ncbi:hypothetical protein MRX96_016793 [Rhipicephalus microplus]
MCPSSAKDVVSCFAIVAMCRNRGIGVNNSLSWRLKKELAYFSRLTKEAAEGKAERRRHGPAHVGITVRRSSGP